MFDRLTSLIGGANIAGATAAPKKSVETLAIEVINGLWSSGEARKEKLIKAGYDYNAVQNKVNEFVKTMQTRTQAMKPWFDACKEQHEWSYNAVYNWGKWSPRSVVKSKEYGTCITYPNAVAMRCKLIKDPAHNVLTSSGSNNDSQKTLDSFWNGSIKAINTINPKYWRTVKYPNKTVKELIKDGKILPGDIIGFMGHTTMYAGKDSKGNLLFNNAGHAAGIYGDKPGSNRAVLNQKVSSYGNRKVYGVFSVNTFGVITSCTNGKITPTNLYMAGQNVKITITPNSGKVVKSIKVDGKVVSNTNTYTISKIDANHKIEVVCDTAPKKKTINEIALEVLDGKWGAGKTRKERLIAAGYDYDAVQKRVNEIIEEREKEKKKGQYKGELPTLRLKKTNAEVIEDTIKWAKWIAGDNRFHYGYGTHAHHNGCYFCGTQRMKKNRTPAILDPDFTYCCNPFVGAAWAHGGCVPAAIKKCQNTDSWDFNVGHGYDSSSLFTKLGKPATSKLKPGDVLCGDSHAALYIGDGKVIQASGGDDNKRNSKSWNNSIAIGTWSGWKRAYRFNGKVDADILMRHGEVSKRVAQWQAFLDWYFNGKVGEADGYFGDNTLKWTKKFQEEVIGKGEGDGICGNKTFTAAKNVVKK